MTRQAVLFGFAVLAAGCAGDGLQTARPDSFDVTLAPATINAGRVGRAYFTSAGERTHIRVEVSGVPNDVTRPVHLHVGIYGGRCGALPADPLFNLPNVLATSVRNPAELSPVTGPFAVTNDAPMSLAQLRTGGYALVIHTAPQDGNREIFCATIAGS